jgi:type II secretory pathway predicted ATPase ExeA
MDTSQSVHPFEGSRTAMALLEVPSFVEALARVLYVAERRRPAGLIVGPAGSGKSALLQRVTGELAGTQHHCELLDLRTTAGHGLLWVLVERLGIAASGDWSDARLWRSIIDRIRGEGLVGRSLVLLLDHLEDCEEHCAVWLRRLVAEAAQSPGLSIILAARHNALAGWRELIHTYCELKIALPAWTIHETRRFLEQLWDGQRSLLITDDALAAMHALCRGRVRNLVQLGRLAWFAARAHELTAIDADHVRLVAGELWPMQPPAALLAPAAADLSLMEIQD